MLWLEDSDSNPEFLIQRLKFRFSSPRPEKRQSRTTHTVISCRVSDSHFQHVRVVRQVQGRHTIDANAVAGRVGKRDQGACLHQSQRYKTGSAHPIRCILDAVYLSTIGRNSAKLKTPTEFDASEM